MSADFRSDTVTLPTASMYSAISEAKLGDDVFDDDPTVHSLQTMAAKMLRKESSLFVPSGTMGNLICCLVHCNDRLSELICGNLSHLHLHEVGGVSALGGIHCKTVRNDRMGMFAIAEMEGLFTEKDDVHQTVTRMVAIENTHNRCGGAAISKEFTDDVCRVCHSYGIAVHVDGARIFNAAVKLGCDVADLVENADSVSFCLSKGLCAPIGSLICGRSSFIEKCRKVRKMLGGGMRQLGVIAACGRVALTEMTKRLIVDHRNASMFVEGIKSLKGISTYWEGTNIVFITFDLEGLTQNAAFVGEQLKEKYSIMVSVYGNDTLRFVTHYHIEEKHIQMALEAIEKIIASIRKHS